MIPLLLILSDILRMHGGATKLVVLVQALRGCHDDGWQLLNGGWEAGSYSDEGLRLSQVTQC